MWVQSLEHQGQQETLSELHGEHNREEELTKLRSRCGASWDTPGKGSLREGRGEPSTLSCANQMTLLHKVLLMCCKKCPLFSLNSPKFAPFLHSSTLSTLYWYSRVHRDSPSLHCHLHDGQVCMLFMPISFVCREVKNRVQAQFMFVKWVKIVLSRKWPTLCLCVLQKAWKDVK